MQDAQKGMHRRWCTAGDEPEALYRRQCIKGYALQVMQRSDALHVMQRRWCTACDAPPAMHSRWCILSDASQGKHCSSCTVGDARQVVRNRRWVAGDAHKVMHWYMIHDRWCAVGDALYVMHRRWCNEIWSKINQTSISHRRWKGCPQSSILNLLSSALSPQSSEMLPKNLIYDILVANFARISTYAFWG